MPIYEYVCAKCEYQFEELVHNGETPACPSCSAMTVTRKLSRFATKGAPGRSCSTCAGGDCGSCSAR